MTRAQMKRAAMALMDCRDGKSRLEDAAHAIGLPRKVFSYPSPFLLWWSKHDGAGDSMLVEASMLYSEAHR